MQGKLNHKIGDVIRIKSEKDIENIEYEHSVNKDCYLDTLFECRSKNYCGKTAKIVEIVYGNISYSPLTVTRFYKLDIDCKVWFWEDWMFEDEENNPPINIVKNFSNLCNNFCYMECNENCPLFDIKDLLTKLYKKS